MLVNEALEVSQHPVGEVVSVRLENASLQFSRHFMEGWKRNGSKDFACIENRKIRRDVAS